MSPTRPTTTKTRIFDGERQVARVDDENNGGLSPKEFALFEAALRKLPQKHRPRRRFRLCERHGLSKNNASTKKKIFR